MPILGMLIERTRDAMLCKERLPRSFMPTVRRRPATPRPPRLDDDTRGKSRLHSRGFTIVHVAVLLYRRGLDSMADVYAPERPVCAVDLRKEGIHNEPNP